MPTELHIKEDGDINDNPSLCYVLIDALGNSYAAQISLNMLETGIEEARKLRKIQ